MKRKRNHSLRSSVFIFLAALFLLFTCSVSTIYASTLQKPDIAASGKFVKDGDYWIYRYDDKTIAKNVFLKIDKKTYYFNKLGHRFKYNRELASEYITCLKQMQQDFDLDYDIKVSTLSRYPEVLVMEEQSVDEEALWESLEPPLREACEKFVQTRILEGRNLEKDLIGKLDSLEEKVLRVEARSPEVVNAYRTKLEAKVSELLEDTQIDDNRIAAEVILFSDKICNDEETVRLHSHIRNMKKMLTTEKEGIGRKLDFMAQEMNREANTILSKSSDLEISNIAIDLKTEIEKVREQIQNVE